MRRADGQASRALVEDLFLSAPLAVMTAQKVLPPGMAAPRGWRRIADTLHRRRETIIVPGDCMDAESHRQFRIRARRARAASAEILHGDDPSALTDSTPLLGMGPTNVFLRDCGSGLRREKTGKKGNKPPPSPFFRPSH